MPIFIERAALAEPEGLEQEGEKWEDNGDKDPKPTRTALQRSSFLVVHDDEAYPGAQIRWKAKLLGVENVN